MCFIFFLSLATFKMGKNDGDLIKYSKWPPKQGVNLICIIYAKLFFSFSGSIKLSKHV